VIAVRGTRFDVEVNQHNVTEIDVFEGLVEVARRGVLGPTVLLEPGFSTRVGMDAGPEPPSPTEDLRPEIEPSGQVVEPERQEEMGKHELASDMGERGDDDQDIGSEIEQDDRGESDLPKPPQF
jgi:hypothetical protein